MNADELRREMAALPEPVTDKEPPYWEYWRHDLWERVVSGQDPAGFLGWPCIYHTMLVNHWRGPVTVEYEALLQDPDRWLGVLDAPAWARPVDYHGDTFYSANLIHQAYHLKLWEDTTGRKIDQLDSIVEFGGGYGAMALVCRRLGFRGKYIIYDLPEFRLLQQYFLAGREVANVIWPAAFKPRRAELMIALYSLSETPLVERGNFLRKVKAQSYLFLYSGKWQDYNNVTYFQDGLSHLAENWKDWEIEHLPDRNNWYSVGW